MSEALWEKKESRILSASINSPGHIWTRFGSEVVMNLDISLRAVNDRIAFPIIEEGGERGGGGGTKSQFPA